jgi:hypothetical protein
MAGIKANLRASASRSRRKFPGKTVQIPASARDLTHKPADRSGKRTWTPKELAAELVEAFGPEVAASERNLVKRCNLPAGHPGHIATLPGFPGRHYIPANEVIRLLAAEVCE